MEKRPDSLLSTVSFGLSCPSLSAALAARPCQPLSPPTKALFCGFICAEGKGGTSISQPRRGDLGTFLCLEWESPSPAPHVSSLFLQCQKSQPDPSKCVRECKEESHLLTFPPPPSCKACSLCVCVTNKGYSSSSSKPPSREIRGIISVPYILSYFIEIHPTCVCVGRNPRVRGCVWSLSSRAKRTRKSEKSLKGPGIAKLSQWFLLAAQGHKPPKASDLPFAGRCLQGASQTVADAPVKSGTLKSRGGCVFGKMGRSTIPLVFVCLSSLCDFAVFTGGVKRTPRLKAISIRASVLLQVVSGVDEPKVGVLRRLPRRNKPRRQSSGRTRMGKLGGTKMGARDTDPRHERREEGGGQY
ncbi:uncharacterized protein LOC128411134 [Podarcis raffonei]|uniref:uncharacterized protein LOC128411134 n=1 Tax=Podarcis raffonei TaxID=65483 RepID=UPI00232917DF|nr:uncharacterized protein LOC128411134 [Podarcis raffonei]